MLTIPRVDNSTEKTETGTSRETCHQHNYVSLTFATGQVAVIVFPPIPFPPISILLLEIILSDMYCSLNCKIAISQLGSVIHCSKHIKKLKKIKIMKELLTHW